MPEHGPQALLDAPLQRQFTNALGHVAFVMGIAAAKDTKWQPQQVARALVIGK